MGHPTSGLRQKWEHENRVTPRGKPLDITRVDSSTTTEVGGVRRRPDLEPATTQERRAAAPPEPPRHEFETSTLELLRK